MDDAFVTNNADDTMTGILTIDNTSSATNSVTDVLVLQSQSSGTPAAGIGTGISFGIETAAGNVETGARIAALTTDVSSTNEDVDLVFYTMVSGDASTEAMRVHDNGNVTISGDLTIDGGNITNAITFDNGITDTGTISAGTWSGTAIAVNKGGTGATAFADKAVIITQDSGTDTLAAVAMSTNGQLLIGGTSGPAVATLTAGSNVSISNEMGVLQSHTPTQTPPIQQEQILPYPVPLLMWMMPS